MITNSARPNHLPKSMAVLTLCGLVMSAGAQSMRDVEVIAKDRGLTNADLIAEVFPGVEVRGEPGAHETLLSIDKARRVLGFDPKHSWHDHV